MQDNLPCKKITLDKPGQKASGKTKLQIDGWSDEGCREAGSQKFEEQGQIEMVGGDFLSQPRPCMGCSVWE
jgi:hypothetical protein